MPRTKKQMALSVAVCADANEDRAALKKYMTTRGWADSGHAYRLDQWQELLEDARQRKFNAVCATIGDLRWFAQVAPETDFTRAEPKREVATPPSPPTPDAVILDRAQVLSSEKPVSAAAIAEALIADGLLAGTLPKATRLVTRVLRHSGKFIARDANEGQPPV